MRIAYIATGAAGMVCGTCIHDNTIAATMQRLGHEVALIPTYTPIRTDEEDVSLDRVFLGGLNVYLQEKIGLFRHTPAFIDNLLNSRPVLNWISRFSASTNARELGRMTVSVLQGEQGHQRKELEKLVAWLRDVYKPDIVHLNHSLIVGFVRLLKRELGVPVVCGAQGEDLFLDSLVEPYQSQARALIREKIQDVDALIATSDYYADFMQDYVGLPRERIHKVYLGIKLDGHGQLEPRRSHEPLYVGYFARICPEKGFHLLVDAFHRLSRKYSAGKVRLRAAGYLGKRDEPFFAEQMARVKALGLADWVEYVGEVDRLGKIAFMSSIDVFTLPAVYRESKGLSVLEALANGVPVVLPEHGNFPEYISQTGGGVLYEPGSAEDLAGRLEELLSDPELRRKMGVSGKQAVHQRFGAVNMAQGTLQVYESCLRKNGVATEPLSAPVASTTADDAGVV